MSNLKTRVLICSQSFIVLAITLFSKGALALDEENQGQNSRPSNSIEEVVVMGRFLNAAQQLLNERRESDSVVDILDSESILTRIDACRNEIRRDCARARCKPQQRSNPNCNRLGQ